MCIRDRQINLILKKTGALVEQAFQGCVRDIAITYQKNSAVTAVINDTAECRGEVEQRIDRLFQSVSYTHLDVYKRQGSTVCLRSRQRRPVKR